MSSVIGSGGVNLAGIRQEAFQYPFHVSGTVTQSDLGKAVALDTTADHTVKLAGDGDMIIGRLDTYEDRTTEGIKVGAVSMKGAFRFPVKTGETVNRGDSVQGAGAGEVKALPATAVAEGGTANYSVAAATHVRTNIVTAVANGFATVILF